METIKVNMNPNPLDVQTIHASQNDGEARQWEFELHNNGELIDTSDVKEQMVFKAYKGGTEQLLPENGSTPTTSPFKGDIKYPQGLLTDQEFIYRQSPTEEDGLAKITEIKGNTLNWNQLVPIDWVPTKTFSDGLSVTNNNDGTYTINGTATQSRFPATSTEIKGIQGHKYFIQLLSSQGKAIITQNSSTVYVYDRTIYTAQNNNAFIIYFNANTYNNEKIIPMIIDLTQMFGPGNEPTTVEEFTLLFPLSYYSYNQGSLLSFNGNGIKTVGKNLLPTDLRMTNLYGLNADKSIYQFNTSSAPFTWSYENSVFRATLPSGQYKVGFIAKTKSTSTSSGLILTDSDNNFIVSRGGSLNNLERGEYSFSLTKTTDLGLCVKVYDGVWWLYIIDAENEMATYEPYTSSTLSLPISTYFPNGMKSAGSVYDELTESKAITRIGPLNFDDFTWRYDPQYSMWVSTTGITNSDQGCLLNANIPYQAIGLSDTSKLGSKINNTYNIWVRNGSNTIQPSGIAYYILASSTETSFTTASLVTENAETPLSNNDGVLIGKCTEELSAEPGFHDAKIKLSDSDGTCYSNKLQLHVERSPQ